MAESTGIDKDGKTWICQWMSCSTTFLLESDLFTHIKYHTQITQPLTCNWKSCSSTTVYTHKGHLNDHIIGHLSNKFVSVQCPICLTGFKRRQGLARHQKKKDCREKDQFLDVDTELETTSKIMNELTLNGVANLVKGRTLNEIEDHERKGKPIQLNFTSCGVLGTK
jgi:hypothetical protein